MVAILLKDLAYAVRLAMRRPALTAVTILTLALGIGGNSAIFALVNGLLLRPLPVERPQELVRVFGAGAGGRYGVASFADLSDLGRRSQTLAGVALHQQTESAYGLGEASETAQVELVSGNYFSLLGVGPGIGRALTPDDDVEGKPEMVAMVSDASSDARRSAARSRC